MYKSIFFLFFTTFLLSACSSGEETKSNQVSLSQSSESRNESELQDQKELEKFPLKPNTVLLTGIPSHRLVTIYKPQLAKDGKSSFIAGNYYHHSASDDSYANENNAYSMGNAWHSHYMPGLEAAYGYNMYNIAHYDLTTKAKKLFFDQHVLVKTIYYPSFLQDTLQGQVVKRDYYLVSVYNEDTNKDSLIDGNDLRRLYHFTIDASRKTALIPLQYSVESSEYDSQNDLMYVFARLDQNSSGVIDTGEPTHVFALNLKSPSLAERLY